MGQQDGLGAAHAAKTGPWRLLFVMRTNITRPASGTSLFDLTPDDARRELEVWIAARGDPDYRTRQVFPRLWQRPAAAWGDASDLPKDLIADLETVHPIPRLELAERQRSNDGTVKYLWRLADGEAIESVWIPMGSKNTLCISSQAGCAYGCVFCATGRMGLQRHLTPWEIVAQVREMALDPESGKPSNVVFMGMGEPLHNWPAVDRALTILNDPNGLAIGARHITVSTVGVVPALRRLAARPEQFRLAVSLHAPTSDRRGELMPVERKYPLPDLLAALRAFRRRVTFEYTMIAGANDSDDDALELAAIAIPLGAMVNLLPLHPGGAPGLTPTTPARIRRFAALVRDRGVTVTIRKSRGLDISAACGQLRVERDRRKRVGTE